MSRAKLESSTFDAIVVGSGITGGWAAKELSERGLNTLVIERGRNVVHAQDYTTEHLPVYNFKFRLMGDKRRYAHDHAVQGTSSFFTEATEHFFVNDRLNPYTTDPDKPYHWLRGHQLGGRSLMWGRQSYRMAPRHFEENARDGHGTDWPIRYEDLAPWYSHVEKFIGVSGEAIHHPMSPDGEFQPPFPMNSVELAFKERAAKAFKDRPVTMARTANLTQFLGNRAPCHYCQYCERGCSPGAYFSSLSSTLPAALATGRLKITTDSIVHSVIYDAKTNRAAGVRVIDAKTHKTREYRAKIVVLCASTFESIRILLNSATARYSSGLANSSGTLGKYILDHFPSDIALAEMDGPALPNFTGGRPVPLHIPRFRNLSEERSDYVRGYQLNGGAWPSGWERGLRMAGFGADFKKELSTTGRWNMVWIAQCESLPRADNTVTLDPKVKDAWGVPAVRINYTYGDNDAAMRKEATTSVVEMFEATGTRDVHVIPIKPVPGESIHEMGGARMGRDPKTSVVNAYNQTHDIPNLLVTDGAAMASASSANPSLTYMALTARACAHAVDEMKRRNL